MNSRRKTLRSKKLTKRNLVTLRGLKLRLWTTKTRKDLFKVQSPLLRTQSRRWTPRWLSWTRRIRRFRILRNSCRRKMKMRTKKWWTQELRWLTCRKPSSNRKPRSSNWLRRTEFSKTNCLSTWLRGTITLIRPWVNSWMSIQKETRSESCSLGNQRAFTNLDRRESTSRLRMVTSRMCAWAVVSCMRAISSPFTRTARLTRSTGRMCLTSWRRRRQCRESLQLCPINPSSGDQLGTGPPQTEWPTMTCGDLWRPQSREWCLAAEDRDSPIKLRTFRSLTSHQVVSSETPLKS